MRVLIAEDDRSTARQLEVILTGWNYDVVVARDGLAAWRLLQAPNPPKMAILDWLMPGLDGVELCRRVRLLREEPYTYLVLLTQKSQSCDLIEGMNAGADDYLTKPLNANELEVRLRAGTRVLRLIDEVIAGREKLRHDATYDSMTGLLNRSAIRESIQRELVLATREQSPLAVIMVDLDYFKRINDTYGHVAGDLVLSEVAQRITLQIRDNDAAGRYGGEEFLVVLPGCDSDTVVGKIEAMRQHIAELPVETPMGAIDVTASIGAALFDGLNPLGVDELISAADVALYAAKDAGRNRSRLAAHLSVYG